MKKTIKDKWVKALRSGKYKQGHCLLKKGNTYCCLGVLTDLYIKAKKKKWTYDGMANGKKIYIYKSRKDISSAYLPKEVQDWAGLKSPDPQPKNHCELTLLNDSRKKTFKQIATIIEKGL